MVVEMSYATWMMFMPAFIIGFARYQDSVVDLLSGIFGLSYIIWGVMYFVGCLLDSSVIVDDADVGRFEERAIWIGHDLSLPVVQGYTSALALCVQCPVFISDSGYHDD